MPENVPAASVRPTSLISGSITTTVFWLVVYSPRFAARSSALKHTAFLIKSSKLLVGPCWLDVPYSHHVPDAHPHTFTATYLDGVRPRVSRPRAATAVNNVVQENNSVSTLGRVARNCSARDKRRANGVTILFLIFHDPVSAVKSTKHIFSCLLFTFFTSTPK